MGKLYGVFYKNRRLQVRGGVAVYVLKLLPAQRSLMNISQNESSQQSFEDCYSQWSSSTDYKDSLVKLMSQLTVMLDGAWLEIFKQADVLHPNRPQTSHYIAMNLVCCGAQGYLATPALNYNIGVGMSGGGKTWANTTVTQSLNSLKSQIFTVTKPKSGDALNSAFNCFPRPNGYFYSDEGLATLLANVGSKTTNSSNYEAYKGFLSCYGSPSILLGSKNKDKDKDTASVLYPRLTYNCDGQYTVIASCLADRQFLEAGYLQRSLYWHFVSPKKVIKSNEMSLLQKSVQVETATDDLVIRDLSSLNKYVLHFYATTALKDMCLPPSHKAILPLPSHDWTIHYDKFCDAIKDVPTLYRQLADINRTNEKIRYLSQLHAWARGSREVEKIDVEVASLIISISYENFIDIYRLSQTVPDEEQLMWVLLKAIDKAGPKGVATSNLYNTSMRFADSCGNPSLKSRHSIILRNLLDDQLVIKAPNSFAGRKGKGFTYYLTEAGKEHLTK